MDKEITVAVSETDPLNVAVIVVDSPSLRVVSPIFNATLGAESISIIVTG